MTILGFYVGLHGNSTILVRSMMMSTLEYIYDTLSSYCAEKFTLDIRI